MHNGYQVNGMAECSTSQKFSVPETGLQIDSLLRVTLLCLCKQVSRYLCFIDFGKGLQHG